MSQPTSQSELTLFVPDRFEKLFPHASAQNLRTIIEPVEDAIDKIKDIHDDMLSGGGGGFIIWRGGSGIGKSTFLQTIHLFIENVETLIMRLFRDSGQGEFGVVGGR